MQTLIVVWLAVGIGEALCVINYREQHGLQKMSFLERYALALVLSPLGPGAGAFLEKKWGMR